MLVTTFLKMVIGQRYVLIIDEYTLAFLLGFSIRFIDLMALRTVYIV